MLRPALWGAVALSCGCGDRVPADATPVEGASPAGPALAGDSASAPVDVGEVNPWAAARLEALRGQAHLGWPVQSVHITSTFGWRVDPVSGIGVRLHRGVDFRGKIGDLALTVGTGTIAFSGQDPLLGNMVIVDHGDGITSLYGHLSDLLVVQGVHVERGAAIGLVGNTGRSAAPHLHLTMKLDDSAVDPMLLLGQPLHRAEAWAAKRPEPEPAPDPTSGVPDVPGVPDDLGAGTPPTLDPVAPPDAPSAPAVVQP